jgi:hypothetical protein
MSYTRGINVITLSIIMILSGCFGLTDDAEADSSTADEPNAAPVIEVFSMSDLTNCDTTGCDAELYHAVVDPDGDLIESGWDLDLDGTIDELVLSNRGTSSLSIANSELVATEMVTDVYTDEGPCYNNQSILTTTTILSSFSTTTIAFISEDTNGAASGVLQTISTPALTLVSTTNTTEIVACTGDDSSGWVWGDKDAQGAGNLVEVSMTSGQGLNWAVVKITISLDGGTPQACAQDDSTASCSYTAYQGAGNSQQWEVSEGITIAGTCDDAAGCNIDVTITQMGVGSEDDRVIGQVTAYADSTA